MSVTAIQKETLDLSAPEQRPREAAWAAEPERRIDAYDAGKLTARDAKDVISDAKLSLGS